MAKPAAGSKPTHQAGPASSSGAFSRALGARLRQLREARGWSQRQLGSRLEILQSKLSKYESGTHQPSLYMLVRMADVFAVSTDYLLTGARAAAPPARHDRLLARCRRLGTAGDDMRAIVLSMLDAILDLDTQIRRGDATSAASGKRRAPVSPRPARPGPAASGQRRQTAGGRRAKRQRQG